MSAIPHQYRGFNDGLDKSLLKLGMYEWLRLI